MRDAVIVDAVRTPIGRRGGGLATVHATDLAATVLQALFERNDLDPAAVDDVILGCVTQHGEQAGNVARMAWLAAGLPDTVPATTVDRQCGSSMQATHFAAQGVLAGAYDVVVAGGVETMSRVPMGSSRVRGIEDLHGLGLRRRYWDAGNPLVGQGVAAELLVDRWGFAREALDDLAFESHRRALRSQAEGRFAREVVPVRAGEAALDADEGPRADIDRGRLAELPPAFREGGHITAGSASQVSDGASALLIMSGERAAALGLAPRARFHAFALAAGDPIEMLTAPIPATRKVLQRAGLSLDEVDLVEINEAFASVVLAWAAELDADLERVNVNGGAIALGHPLGATGARLTATLLCELERRDARWGLQTICEGGGLANATIIERLS